MLKRKKIVLTTMPLEGEFVNWCTPTYYLPRPDRVTYMPLGILSLATNLGNGYNVVILDPPSYGWGIEETISRIEDEKPDILGLSVVTQRVYAMCEILKKTTTSYKVVGGPHTTHYANQALKAGADAVFVGPLADREFSQAVDAMPKGIVYCNTDIVTIKFPKRELLNFEEYFPKDAVLFKAEKRLPMFASIGCPFRCIFCDVQTKKQQRKSPQVIVDEMQYLYSIGSRSIHILDDNLNVDERFLGSILGEMEVRNFSVEWSGRGQPSMSRELIARLAKHSFKRFHVGIEAFSDDILRYLKKSTKAAEIFEFCATMSEHDIDLIAYFILGTPVETKDYLKWLPQKIKALGIKYPYFNILFPAPNTEYYAQLLKDGTYTKDFWAEFMENPTPDFQIPFPHGKKVYEEISLYVQELIKEFNNKEKAVLKNG